MNALFFFAPCSRRLSREKEEFTPAKGFSLMTLSTPCHLLFFFWLRCRWCYLGTLLFSLRVCVCGQVCLKPRSQPGAPRTDFLIQIYIESFRLLHVHHFASTTTTHSFVSQAIFVVVSVCTAVFVKLVAETCFFPPLVSSAGRLRICSCE
jgi:hypothetical protein